MGPGVFTECVWVGVGPRVFVGVKGRSESGRRARVVGRVGAGVGVRTQVCARASGSVWVSGGLATRVRGVAASGKRGRERRGRPWAPAGFVCEARPGGGLFPDGVLAPRPGAGRGGLANRLALGPGASAGSGGWRLPFASRPME